MFCLASDGIISQYDVDSDGIRFQLSSKMKLSHFESGVCHAICVGSDYFAVSEKSTKAYKAILIAERLEMKFLYAIELPRRTVYLNLRREQLCLPN